MAKIFSLKLAQKLFIEKLKQSIIYICLDIIYIHVLHH